MRRLHRLVLVGAPALVLCLAGPAAAGSISISIQPVVELREGALSAQVKVSNVGDEAPESVAAVLVFGEHKARGEIHPSLAPGASVDAPGASEGWRSEEHTSELQSPFLISYAVFCLKKKKKKNNYLYINVLKIKTKN